MKRGTQAKNQRVFCNGRTFYHYFAQRSTYFVRYVSVDRLLSKNRGLPGQCSVQGQMKKNKEHKEKCEKSKEKMKKNWLLEMAR